MALAVSDTNVDPVNGERASNIWNETCLTDCDAFTFFFWFYKSSALIESPTSYRLRKVRKLSSVVSSMKKKRNADCNRNTRNLANVIARKNVLTNIDGRIM